MDDPIDESRSICANSMVGCHVSSRVNTVMPFKEPLPMLISNRTTDAHVSWGSMLVIVNVYFDDDAVFDDCLCRVQLIGRKQSRRFTMFICHRRIKISTALELQQCRPMEMK